MNERGEKTDPEDDVEDVDRDGDAAIDDKDGKRNAAAPRRPESEIIQS